MTFSEYYSGRFRDDITRFMMSIPAESRNHELDKSIFTVQYDKLTKDTAHLEVIPSEDRSNFAVALYFTVLVDEVCYTHYKAEYSAFRALTMYPKFIGNCPGACQYHLHPQNIFAAINHSRDNGKNNARRPDIFVYDSLSQAIEIMKHEVFDFFTKYMTAINPSEFWHKCTAELPFNINDEK